MMEIHELLKEFDDLNEPACMDKILIYLDQLKYEDDAFMELLVKKVGGQEVTWMQPWYQQTNSISRPLKENNEEHKEKYKTDTICKAETEQILKNWQEFMEEYDVPDQLICLARWKNKDKSRLPNTPEECARRFLIAYLAQGLQRTPFQVLRHIQTYFGGPVKGHYKPEEERIMEVVFRQHPNNAVILLSMLLGREPRGIYRRLQLICDGKPERKRIKWTVPLATRFLKLLMEYTGLPLEELKNKTFDKEVWLKLGEQFDHHYVYLQRFWYDSLHVQIFVKRNVKVNHIRKMILKKLRMFPYQIWSDIRWKDVVQQFPEGYTCKFLYGLCRGLIRKMPQYQKVPLEELIEYGLNKLRKCRKRRLRTLQFNENGQLEQVIYQSKDKKE